MSPPRTSMAEATRGLQAPRAIAQELYGGYHEAYAGDHENTGATAAAVEAHFRSLYAPLSARMEVRGDSYADSVSG